MPLRIQKTKSQDLPVGRIQTPPASQENPQLYGQALQEVKGRSVISTFRGKTGVSFGVAGSHAASTDHEMMNGMNVNPIKGVKRGHVAKHIQRKISQSSSMSVLPKSPVSMRMSLVVLFMLWFSATTVTAILPRIVRCRRRVEFPRCFNIPAPCPPTCLRNCLMDCATCKPVCSKFIQLFYRTIMMLTLSVMRF